MFGAHVETLNVFIQQDSNRTLIWTRSNTQGNIWRQALRTIVSYQSYKVKYVKCNMSECYVFSHRMFVGKCKRECACMCVCVHAYITHKECNVTTSIENGDCLSLTTKTGFLVVSSDLISSIHIFSLNLMAFRDGHGMGFSPDTLDFSLLFL